MPFDPVRDPATGPVRHSDPVAETIAAYDADAARYAMGLTAVRAEVDDFAARLPTGAWVLEIGSGPGHDADRLAEHGLRVRRTDVTPAFVALLRAAGHEAELLDPLVDDLGGPHDAVWASACLLHVARTDLPVVLTRLAAATRPGGLLRLSVKEGDGEAWSTHGQVAAPRHFVYWREAPLRAVLAGAGWRVEELRRTVGARDDWLDVLATCAGVGAR